MLGRYYHRSNKQQRRLKFTEILWFFVVMIAIQMSAHGQEIDPLDVACDEIFAKLSQGQVNQLEMHYQRFAEESNLFDGCVITMKAPSRDLFDGSYPRSLFKNGLKDGLDGKDSHLGPVPKENKWILNKEADGPDGSSFRANKGQVFCLVSAAWDGGDDSDPTYVPQKNLEMLIQCAYK